MEHENAEYFIGEQEQVDAALSGHNELRKWRNRLQRSILMEEPFPLKVTCAKWLKWRCKVHSHAKGRDTECDVTFWY